MAGSSKRAVRSGGGRRPARRPTRRPRKVSKAVRTYVKRTIHNNLENKIVVVNQSNNNVTTALSGAQAPYSINCIPIVGEGSEQGERVGVTINPRACTIRGFINIKPQNTLTNPYAPIKVKMWLCSYKLQNRNATALQLADFDRFFEAGNSTVGFQGNILDMILPVNKADWTLYEMRTINLGTSSTSSGHAGSGFVYDASRFSVPFYFNVGKHLKQKLIYDDLSSSRPTNRNMYVFVQAVAAEGSAGGGVYIPCEVHYSHKFEFEDA